MGVAWVRDEALLFLLWTDDLDDFETQRINPEHKIISLLQRSTWSSING